MSNWRTTPLLNLYPLYLIRCYYIHIYIIYDTYVYYNMLLYYIHIISFARIKLQEGKEFADRYTLST